MFKPVGITALVIAAGASIFVAPASATPTNLSSGGSVALSSSSSFIVGNLLYSFSSCNDSKVPAVCTGDGATTGGIITASGTNGFVISGPNGGNFLTDSSTPPADDVTVQFTVTTTDSTYLDGVSYAITGSGNFTAVNDTIIGLATGSAALVGTNGNGTAASSVSFVPSKSITVSADMRSASLPANTPSSVTSTSQTFQTVPEPASIMAFAAGLLGLAAGRRKRTN